ncbi:hypothetical protein ASG12_03830 [Williamsia sp. Leaf354]|uniref:hypothetical protein n=1 Tax=Williamsia sp. Leaf354 TaxID=1736349 RepID=UPI0006F82E71|nr:hypothetical protein [Williamsia sp. Leaf354]KQR99901.1 hypothetical protein ASG12_03830 [Williamsia sp. Leaf354]
MPDWTYVPLEPIASTVIGERRTRRYALALLAVLVRLGGRHWIPIVFAHPEVPDAWRGRFGATVPVSVARDAITCLPVQGATVIHVHAVTAGDVDSLQAATAGRRCRVVAICDTASTAAAVAQFVDNTRVGADRDTLVLRAPDVDDATAALTQANSVVLADPELLVASGPGWFHRVIEAHEAIARADEPAPLRWPTRREATDVRGWPAWIWAMLAGVGLVVGGLGAAAITLGPVLLGYDRDYLGLSVSGLNEVDTHLVGFLQHDRITMAGNMVGLGTLYCGLAWGGLRHGRRWARNALAVSGVVAFGTWLYFLATGFVEPLHTLVVVALAPLLVVAVWRAPALPVRPRVSDGPARERAAALWGQLMMIGVGGGLVVAGTVISTVGLTAVFVPTDLGYLETSAEALRDANQNLLPFIAHDRAGFGGALVGSGLAVLLISLWGWRRGERWVWWSLLLGCLFGTAPALAVHLDIGYTTLSHLLPLYVLVVVVAVALWISRPFLTARSGTSHRSPRSSAVTSPDAVR